MEHLPDWPKLALQRVGDTPGPLTVEEELSEQEITWCAFLSSFFPLSFLNSL
jgi:hypothetical protein